MPADLTPEVIADTEHADIARLKAWLVAHESLWQAVSGSPVEIVLLILHQLQAENERLTAERDEANRRLAEETARANRNWDLLAAATSHIEIRPADERGKCGPLGGEKQ